jgi:hydroxymethylpyrimidine/phosphomethylpyrimidine kinase
MPRAVLSIAGSDPSGGAGIQSDLRTFAAHRLYGTALLAAETVQDTRGVQATRLADPEFLRAQLRVLVGDVRLAAAKTGMLGSAAQAAIVAAEMPDGVPLVVDPLLASTGGVPLFGDGVGYAPLLLRATLLTPNLSEARALLGAGADVAVEDLARALLALGPRAVVVKGGHREGAVVTDVYADRDGIRRLRSARIETGDTHGTGCLHSASAACALALGASPEEAARHAQRCVVRGLRGAVRAGAGRGSPALLAAVRYSSPRTPR